jgi:hypothetical protein
LERLIKVCPLLLEYVVIVEPFYNALPGQLESRLGLSVSLLQQTRWTVGQTADHEGIWRLTFFALWRGFCDSSAVSCGVQQSL